MNKAVKKLMSEKSSTKFVDILIEECRVALDVPQQADILSYRGQALDWIKEHFLKEEEPYTDVISIQNYREAIRLISQQDFSVAIEQRNDTGENLWVLVANNTDDFWIDAFQTVDEAFEFCRISKLKIRQDCI